MKNWTIFRKIEDYENYEVSIHGDVRHRKFKRLKKASYDKDGYLTVGLFENSDLKFKKVHRLVGQAFIDNKGLPQINHKDEDKTNNHFTNLEWCTPAYNCNYGTRIQRISESRLEKEALARA
jgi:hypothetical protein